MPTLARETLPSGESNNYPVVDVVCDHCQQLFQGKMGPIAPNESYPLHIYKDQIVGDKPHEQISAWNLPPERRYIGGMLLNHHLTVRSGSQGHHQFTVYLHGQKVGVIRVSTSSQFFESTESAQ